MIHTQIFWGKLTLSSTGSSLGLGIVFCCCLSLCLKPAHGFPFQTVLMTLSRVTIGSSHLFKQSIEMSSVPLGTTSGRYLHSWSCTLRISSPRYLVSHLQAGFLNRLQASPFACLRPCPSASWKCVQGFPVWNERSPDPHSFHSYSAQPIKETWARNYFVHLQVREWRATASPDETSLNLFQGFKHLVGLWSLISQAPLIVTGWKEIRTNMV